MRVPVTPAYPHVVRCLSTHMHDPGYVLVEDLCSSPGAHPHWARTSSRCATAWEHDSTTETCSPWLSCKADQSVVNGSYLPGFFHALHILTGHASTLQPSAFCTLQSAAPPQWGSRLYSTPDWDRVCASIQVRSVVQPRRVRKS